MVKNNFGDSLAQSMDQVLNSAEHKNIFAKPKAVTKTASKKASDNVQDAFNALIDTSAKLDELGLHESALETLKAAHSLAAEAGLMKEANLPEFMALPGNKEKNPTLFLTEEEPIAEMEEDPDLAGLLEELEEEESNDVMDVPSETDMLEGLETTT